MNPDLSSLQTYPFEKLELLQQGINPVSNKPHIALSIGAPRHKPAQFINTQLVNHLKSLAHYPPVKGIISLRETIATWLIQRFGLKTANIDPERHIIPVNGTREALFAFAQATVDRSKNPLVLMPNPFYQIYEGAALLAGAQPWYMNTTADTHFLPDFSAVPHDVWERCQLIYICSPGNPSGAIIEQQTLQSLIQLADKHDFIIASDECYSEIYFDEKNPPIGLLQAAQAMGRDDFKRCVVFNSLSKRSNVPGLRSGFVAGDADIMSQYLLYRTYHGCVVPTFVQAASQYAWADEKAVIQNRQAYREKFAKVMDILSPVLAVDMPEAAFFLWPEIPIDDESFCKKLYKQQNVSVLPGSYLSRYAQGINPGENRVRIALVAELNECIDAATRITEFVKSI